MIGPFEDLSDYLIEINVPTLSFLIFFILTFIEPPSVTLTLSAPSNV